jgi:hypothetical protein
MKYDAITIDANVVIRAGFRFENAQLAQLKQFHDGPTEFVLSEVVVREIHKHLTAEIRRTEEGLRKAVAEGAAYGLLAVDPIVSREAEGENKRKHADIAQELIDQFIGNTGAEVIPAEKASIADLLDAYFNATPPFEASGNKKREFPDAIALLSVQALAKESNRRVLAVSDDKGWLAFKSEHVDVVGDLGTALQLLQDHVHGATQVVQKVLTAIDQGSDAELISKFTEMLDRAVSSIEAYSEASSSMHSEGDQAEIRFLRFRLIPDDNNRFDVRILRTGKDQIVAQVPIEIEAEASADFSFSVWDSIDREYISIGSNSAITETTFECLVILTLEGSLLEQASTLELTNVELAETPDMIDFDTVEYSGDDSDFGEDRFDPDP